MGRKPLPPSELKTQIKIALAPEMRARLELEAAERGLTIAEVIRNRLDEGFLREQLYDEPTRDLAAAIMGMAVMIAHRYAPWHKNAKARTALVTAMAAYLSYLSYAPDMEERAADGADPFAEDDPGTVGRMVARTLLEQGEWDGLRKQVAQTQAEFEQAGVRLKKPAKPSAEKGKRKK